MLLMVMTAAAAFAFSKLQTPVYKSSVDILVQPARPDFGLAQTAKILLRSYVSYMNTDKRAEAVVNVLGLDRLPAELRSDVTIASDESRLVIQLTVEDTDGDLANDIAQAWTDLFVQWRNAENSLQRKEDQVDAIQLDAPRYSLARPKWKVNVLAGAVLGALIGGVIVFVLEWVESGVVRRPEDIERYLGLPLLGSIPALKIDVSQPHPTGGLPGASPAAWQPATHPSARTPNAHPFNSAVAKPGGTSPGLPPDQEGVGPIEPTLLHPKEGE